MPSPGLIQGLRPASGPGVRDDGGVSVGYDVPVFYDSMIAKLITWGASRREAVDRMSRALREYQVLGIRTTIPFFLWLMRQPDYVAGRYDTTYLDRLLAERNGALVQRTDRGGRGARVDCDGARRVSAHERARASGRAGELAGAWKQVGAARGAARMTFDIDVNGRSRMVSVERAAAGRYRVVVDGRPHEIDAARVGTFGLSLLLDGDSGRESGGPGGTGRRQLGRCSSGSMAGR